MAVGEANGAHGEPTHVSGHVDTEELKRGGVVKLQGKDLYSMWVKTNCCNLTSDQLRRLGEIVDKYARGFLLFTTRQIPIIPFVQLSDVGKVKEELRKIELELDRCGPRVRNVNVCLGERACQEAILDPISLAEFLNHFFYDSILHKIKIGVSGCEKDCIFSRVLNDISFVATVHGLERGFDAYVGGKLGTSPFVGEKVASCLSKTECINLVQNYFTLLRAEGLKGERSADLVRRLGFERVRNELTKNLRQDIDLKPIRCGTALSARKEGCVTARIRATCGEVTSSQLQGIADMADKYGEGIVHFAVRGSPEIPHVRKENLEDLREELDRLGLETLQGGLDNIQSCFGNYCTESLADPQTLLRRVEGKARAMGLADLSVSVSGSGCPNSCGIPQLSDIGFMGVVRPKVDGSACSGCGLCVTACREHAISIQDGVAQIDYQKCRSCGQCIALCPTAAILPAKKGFAVLIGGRGGKATRLGERIAEFLTEDEAFRVAESCLQLCKKEGCELGKLVDRIGLNRTKELVLGTGAGKTDG